MLRVTDFCLWFLCLSWYFEPFLQNLILLCVCVVIQIINSCGGPELARSVISPLLSKDATDFLKGHLTPKEISLWDSLGEAWTRSRWGQSCCLTSNPKLLRHAWFYSYVIFGSFPGTRYCMLWDRCYFLTIYFFPASHSRAEWPREANIPTYIPKFRNGWEPPIEIFRGAPWEIDIGHLQEEVSFVLWTILSPFHPSFLFFRRICTAYG